MIIVSQVLLNLLTLNNKRVTGMALWPFIFLKDKETRRNNTIVNHEKIHHRQQLELLIIPYYIWYFIEYWTAMFRNKFKHHISYMSVSFEKEAYANQDNLEYLKTRKWLASYRYL